MATGQINWEQFITSNNDARGVKYKFEDLCRQLFTYEYISKNKVNRYLHSNPNNAGIESEPILDEENNKYIGYQAKYFDNVVNYGQIKESAEKAVKYYAGHIDCIYLFCNKALTTTCDSYKKVEAVLNTANIELIPITDTMILDWVRKYPLLGKYYFDEHGITHEWLVNNANIAASILGERYNPEFNVDTEAAKNLSVFLQDNNAIAYFNNKKKRLIEELISLRWELSDYKTYLHNLREFIDTIVDVRFDTIHEVEVWQDRINEQFENEIKEIKAGIQYAQSELDKVQESDRKKASECRNRINKLTRLFNLYFGLDVSEIESKLLNNNILVVEGRAGIGKTQLFANEAFTILNDNEDALLVIGGDCLADYNILDQLKDNLRLKFQFEDIIDILEVVGEKQGRIVPILIDALNESWEPKLWKLVLPIIQNKINGKRFVRLAISFRSEYENTILPERFFELDGVVKIEHRGFKSNSMEAAKEFLAYYGLSFTPIQMFSSNIDNPLFLTLYCKTYQGDDVGLQMLYDRLLDKANDKIYTTLERTIRSAGFDASDNIVSMIVDAISKEILATGKRQFEKSELANLSIWNELDLPPIVFIIQLIKENVLQGYVSESKDYVCFAYDQMNDYYTAKAIMAMCHTEDELKNYVTGNVLGIVSGEMMNWENEALFINVCALYADKFHKECIDIIDLIIDKDDRKSIFKTYLESFEWRNKVYMSIEEFFDYCNKYYMDPNIVWLAFITNSVKANHLLNADALHNALIKYPLNKRDYIWTQYINGLTSEDDRVVQLIKLYNKGESLQVGDKEQIRLLLILFSWMLTSSNRWLRDTTSKAIIEILKENFGLSEYLLKLFSNVNDPYIIQRLYGIVFGACVKRNGDNKDAFRSLVEFVYESIFNNEVVYPDILLRDYARLIIERFFFEYPVENLNIDLNKIKPPYKSVPIPEIEDKRYGNKNFSGGEFNILHSMRFEGMGMYGDFGRYVFQSAIRNFEVDEYKVFNYAMSYIFEELGYSNDYFDYYDNFVARYSYDRHRTLKTERIGKKYQWIAMYNILARISDFYPMKNRYSIKEEHINYDGPWEPYVRDFDPTLNENNLFDKTAPLFIQLGDHIKEAVQENDTLRNKPDFDEIAWTRLNSVFFKYQKSDLLLTDQDGVQWVVLSKYADTGRDDLVNDNLMEWNWLYGYFVSDEQLAVLKECVGKRINILCNDITGIPQTYMLYNREYSWSNASASILEWQYKDVELPTGETQTIMFTTEEPNFSAYESILAKYMREVDEEVGLDDENDNTELEKDSEFSVVSKTYTREEPVTIRLGKILNTTQDLLWEEEFDASKEETLSYSHPCAELINSLNLRQKTYDGYYYDSDGILVAFDTDLTKQKAGLIIRKSALDKFLAEKNYHLIWFINAAKEIHDKTRMVTNYTDWTGLLEYTGDSVEGDYYPINPQ